ncbi:RHS repeat-associated core domain-containing protein [Flavobacterium sp. SUN046]|uniref:RHS repeat domain-containing protein n=1 Tax=Flavobacterium sp. SUN046 TaxID=3002440 RepID=UPI002DBCD542|nr:RHS repeat-associated core domain-containing protein [Flavobacterium sp. SUN046]MEC4048615.1 RHS repeat-associated core domain-containing protein [Flavobacterium sp. SUN046]
MLDANLNTTVETFYVDGFQYKGDNLQFFPHAEGYVNCNAPKLLLVPTSDGGLQEVYLDDGTPTFSYVYNYTDHLGNIRLSYTKNPQSGALSIIEENHYYPFGLKHNNYNSDKNMYAKEQEQLKIKPVPPLFKPAYNYKYNGKELQDEMGLNMYDYGARNYDPAIGRWMNIDPKAETSRRWSPYNYTYNNPIYFVDPDGMKADIWVNGENKKIYDTSLNGGKGGYTEYATEQDKKYGESLRTEGGVSGAMQFEQLVSDRTQPTEIKFMDVNGKSEMGYLFGKNHNDYTTNPDGSVKNITKSTIEVYTGTAKAYAEDVKNGTVMKGLDESTLMTPKVEQTIKDSKNITADNIITAVIGHEIGHENANNQNAVNSTSYSARPEACPREISSQILINIENNKK